MYQRWKPYVPVAARRAASEREAERRRKKGENLSPVVIHGRTIASTFWGKAWCENLERYSDFANRLPRGRTYVRNGSVIDLQIFPGSIKALVSGSELYKVEITVSGVHTPLWTEICRDCAGSIDSVVELLQGRLSGAVMTRICQPDRGMFPTPPQLNFSCSCPDYASMCKHVATTLYGVGARLDTRPELLFQLRKVDPLELIAQAGVGATLTAAPPPATLLRDADLSALFGLDLLLDEPVVATPAAKAAAPAAKPTSPPRAKAAAPAVKPAAPAKVAASTSRAEPPKASSATKTRATPAQPQPAPTKPKAATTTPGTTTPRLKAASAPTPPKKKPG
jgi:uncharacterized Zn finger protein